MKEEKDIFLSKQPRKEGKKRRCGRPAGVS
jgi:hypothetical protein